MYHSTGKIKKTSKILIVEDHPIFRMGLADLINDEEDLEVCGTAEDVDSAVRAVETLLPDMVVIDLSLKKSNGFDLLRLLARQNRALPLLVLSMHDEEVHAERCLHEGARGYINKKEASGSVIKAIRHILKGNIFLSRSMTESVLNKFRLEPDLPYASPVQKLSHRELQVFYSIGKGKSSRAIARELNVSTKTIGTHKERIKEKLLLGSAAELVRFAILWVEKEGQME
ncbi:MAG: DNA-binding response regulator [Desulfobacterales bacterium RIFOXYA12_FULL_46_15]|nr:MAG: DNA-binding response regulator [Desulfobacterales bacterium RIFOXYA12_FULL_46_15]